MLDLNYNMVESKDAVEVTGLVVPMETCDG